MGRGRPFATARPAVAPYRLSHNFALALGLQSLLCLTFFHAPVAQLDRASDYGSEGLGFDSLRVRQFHWRVAPLCGSTEPQTCLGCQTTRFARRRLPTGAPIFGAAPLCGSRTANV